MAKKETKQNVRWDQLFLGIAIGVLIATMIISVITYSTINEVRENTGDSLVEIQQKLDELESR